MRRSLDAATRQQVIGRLRRYLHQDCRVEEGQQCASMTVFPVFPRSPSEAAFDYAVLDEAISRRWVVITEQTSATVPALVLTNGGPGLVLAIDGQEVVGGRQNRVLNTSVLVDAASQIVLPVSCVEAHRWHPAASHRFTSGETLYATARQSHRQSVHRNLRQNRGHASDQQQVWDDLREAAAGHGANSGTQAMHAIYETRRQELAELARGFPYPAGAVGMVVAIDGLTAGADLFDRPVTAARLWQRLIRSYALDALLARSRAPVDPSRARRVLERAVHAPAEVYESPGLGCDVRLAGHGITGSALIYREVPVHVSLLRDHIRRRA